MHFYADSAERSEMTGIVDAARLLAQMTGYNPWWTGTVRKVPPFHRVAFNKCFQRLLDERSRRAVLLSGPRRVGKSTILLQIAHELMKRGVSPTSVLYLSLDDNLLKLATLPELLTLYHESILPEGHRAYLLLDEVHFSTDWDSHVKSLIDHRPEYRVLATGSASIENRQRTADTGVGRWITITIPTLSFYEYLHLIEKAPPGVTSSLKASDFFRRTTGDRTLLASAMRPTLPLFRRYLLTGGFPETAQLSDVVECQRLLREDIVDKVLKRDVTALFGVRHVADLERLFLYVCLHSGGIINTSTCSSELGLARSTVDDHLDILVRSNLLYRLGPFARGGKKILKARYKKLSQNAPRDR
jgi:predicted AAA+ superfamily ATPase